MKCTFVFLFIQLLGYSEKPINLQMFIGTADDRYLRPHAFYQVHRITGKTVATASQEIIIASTKVLEIPLLPENNMSARYLFCFLWFFVCLFFFLFSFLLSFLSCFSLCNSGYPETSYVDHGSLELIEIHLSLHLKTFVKLNIKLTQQLKSHTLSEDQRQVLHTHIRQLTTAYISSSRLSDAHNLHKPLHSRACMPLYPYSPYIHN